MCDFDRDLEDILEIEVNKIAREVDVVDDEGLLDLYSYFFITAR